MAQDRKFIDTNILVYAEQVEDKLKQKVAHEQLKQLVSSGNGFISNQIISELSSLLIRYGCRKAAILQAVQSYHSAFNYIVYSVEDIELACTLAIENKATFFDSLIAATMKNNGISIIITENEKDFRKFDFLEIENHF